MLSIIFLFAGGMALVGSMIPDEEPDGNLDQENTGDEDQLLEPHIETNLLDDFPKTPTDLSPASSAETTSNASGDHEPNLIDTIDNSHAELSDAVNDSSEISILEISADNISNYPTALTDWTESEKVSILDLGENDVLSVRFPGGNTGSLVVLDADYLETVSQTANTTFTTHHGANIYFVPEGETFPSQYEWSEDGAVLFNALDYHSNNTEFGGIRLLARIDSGTSASEIDSEGNLISSLNNMLGDPQVISNLPLVYL